MKVLIGRKRGMTRVFDATGEVVPVTVVEAGPCVVTQVRSESRDGYSAVQLGFEEVTAHKLTKARRGHLSRNGLPMLRYLKEFRAADPGGVKVGDRLTADVFKAGDRVDVSAVSKGHGFAGTVKRHGFHRQRKSHGQSDRERAPGAIGAGTTPGRVFKGLRMAGQMGAQRVTVLNLEVVATDAERNLVVLRGGVPGPNGGLVMLRSSRRGGLQTRPRGP